MIPFTSRIQQQCHSKARPNNQEVAMNADGSGGAVTPFKKKNAAGKEQGSDGKACWSTGGPGNKGYRYAGTKNGKDKCVPIG
jgi:hypothetical protein